MAHAEYLVGFGLSGDFGRFRTAEPLSLRRGSRVVVRSERGLELGSVLRPASERAARLMADSAVGELVRPAGPDDEQLAGQMQRRAADLLARGGRLIEENGLPAALL